MRQVPKFSRILIEHVLMDEDLPPDTRELVEEFAAEGLFQIWLIDVRKGKGEDESCSVPS